MEIQGFLVTRAVNHSGTHLGSDVGFSKYIPWKVPNILDHAYDQTIAKQLPSAKHLEFAFLQI